MATTNEITSFIKMIAPLAQKAYKAFGKVKPSVCIGMACIESGYGTAPAMRKHNAYLGHKVGSGKTALKYWDGTFFKSKTSEEYQVGVHTVIVDAFRSYKDTEQCVFNFYELMNTSLYSQVLSGSNYEEQMKQIKACKYMTSSKEVNSVISVINRYNLTIYDDKFENPYKLTDSSIHYGDRGENVKWLQFNLNRNGADLKIDGIYGPLTKSAVLNFKKLHDLDSVVDFDSLQALIK